jgi:hypothetical protein
VKLALTFLDANGVFPPILHVESAKAIPTISQRVQVQQTPFYSLIYQTSPKQPNTGPLDASPPISPPAGGVLISVIAPYFPDGQYSCHFGLLSAPATKINSTLFALHSFFLLFYPFPQFVDD